MRFHSLTPFFVGGTFALTAGTLATGRALADPPQTPPSVALPAPAPVAVLTQHNDIARTGANLRETVLNTTTVRPALGSKSGFGKLFSRKVDGQIYAQPLYVPGMTIKGVKRNVVFVATMHNTVYAFDADDPAAAEPLWKTSFLDDRKGVLSCPINEVGGWDTNIYPEVGIVSTPVIEPVTQAIYCVTKTKEVSATGQVSYPSRLRALDLATGKNLTNSGVEIAATVRGTGDGANGDGTLTFDPARHMNRPGLLLLKGIIYIAFGAHSDITPYHGWVFAYQVGTLNKIAVWCSTPNGKTDPTGYPIGAGGIWQSGQGLTADAQDNIYLEVGNGSFSADKGGVDYGDSFVKLRLTPVLTPFGKQRVFTVTDYFTPYNQDWLNRVDADLGVSGPMLIPGTSLLVGGGKEGRLYLLDQNNMGLYNSKEDNQIPQWLWGYNGHLHGSPVFWNTGDNSNIYIWGEYDRLKLFRLNKPKKQFFTMPIATSEMYVPNGMPGAMLSVSANGSKAGTGIVWASHPYDDDSIHKVVPGIVRAFDAANLQEIWNSKMVPERDDIGLFAKFCPPTVVNGKVYMASFSNELAVYGLGTWTTAPVISPKGGEYRRTVWPGSVTLGNVTTGTRMYYTTDGSEPTESSLLYTKPIVITQSTVVRARAFSNNALPSPIATAKYLIDDGPGKGNGLLGSYFNNTTLDGTPVTRIDGQINWPDIGGTSPVDGVGPDNWSCRWSGKIEPRATGKYTFSTNSDDGIRLWVNGQLIIDDWTYHGPTIDTGSIVLEQGKKYDIKLEFFQGGGGATVQLFWASAFWDTQLIPRSQLYSK